MRKKQRKLFPSHSLYKNPGSKCFIGKFFQKTEKDEKQSECFYKLRMSKPPKPAKDLSLVKKNFFKLSIVTDVILSQYYL